MEEMKYEQDTQLDKGPTLDSDRRNGPWRDCPCFGGGEIRETQYDREEEGCAGNGFAELGGWQ